MKQKSNTVKLLIIPLILASVLLLSCADSRNRLAFSEYTTKELQGTLSGGTLTATADMGEEYIDSLIFFGESTTYHLKSRGVLSGGKDTTQVWGAKNGTANLDTTIRSMKIVYPETGEEMTLREAAQKKKPKAIVLTFGLNGAVQKVRAGEELFKGCYMSLINEILSGSPDTVIILQSCFPIALDMDMSNYSVDAKTLNAHITLINTWTEALAADKGFYYLNTAETLCDNEGFLLAEYDSGDGHHLSTEAYLKILEYIRTHGYRENK